MIDDIEVEEKTEFTFAELSDTAKLAALDMERYSEGYLSYEWWDSVYEDAVQMAAILGIEIATSQERTVNKRIRTFMKPDISFSGFSSQGDGACFKGSYASKPDAVEKIANAAPQDKELHRIAAALGTMGVTQRLLGLEPFKCEIITRGNYSHSGTMQLTYDGDYDHLEQDLLRLFRDFADWIYKQLEDEHDHLMSDDTVSEQLEDLTFDESGSVI